MAQKEVTSTEFQIRADTYIEQAGKEPIFITQHRRRVRVLVDIDEYDRLKTYDTREVLYPDELSDALKTEFDKGYQGVPTPDLDHLME